MLSICVCIHFLYFGLQCVAISVSILKMDCLPNSELNKNLQVDLISAMSSSFLCISSLQKFSMVPKHETWTSDRELQELIWRDRIASVSDNICKSIYSDARVPHHRSLADLEKRCQQKRMEVYGFSRPLNAPMTIFFAYSELEANKVHLSQWATLR